MRRLDTSILGPLGVAALLVLQSGMAALASTPPTIFIDDSRDGVQCPGALDVVDLFTMNPFPVQDGQTITFCSGEYNGTLGIDGAHNVTITGMVDPMLGPPRIIPARLAGSLGSVLPDIVSVKNSTNVTIRNLSLDGAPKGSTTANWNPALTDVNGIHVVNSSVTITDNAISRIHPQTPKTQGGTGILVEGTASAVQAINITDNTIYDFNGAGVVVKGFAARFHPIITGNFIWSVFDGTMMAGVQLTDVSTGTVSGNSIAATFNYVDLPNCLLCGIGVELEQTQHVKVTNNDISYVFEGILVGTIGSRDVIDNTVTGNTILGAQQGIELFTGGAIQVADNQINNNKVIKYDQQPSQGISMFSFDPAETIRNNTISGNTVLGYGPPDAAITTFDPDPAHFKIKSNKFGFATGVQ